MFGIADIEINWEKNYHDEIEIVINTRFNFIKNQSNYIY
jgi:hypothetical protein